MLRTHNDYRNKKEELLANLENNKKPNMFGRSQEEDTKVRFSQLEQSIRKDKEASSDGNATIRER